ncbi:MAG: hypothetical protein ACJ74N_08115 [Gaiellaceae bacterium]
MTKLWTHGVFTVRPGREDEFAAGWKAMAPIGERLGSGRPILLRDRDRPNVFRSFGSWPDHETIERFRAEIMPRIGAMDELLEGVETFTLDEVFPAD